jgi:hypothetical protein
MRYLLKSEVAKRIRCHPVHVMRLVRQGILRAPVKLTPNGRCLFVESHLEEDLAKASKDEAA